MRKTLIGIFTAAAILMSGPAFAELQNVTIDGSIQVRANFYWDAIQETPQPGFWQFSLPTIDITRAPLLGDIQLGRGPIGALAPRTGPIRWWRDDNDFFTSEQRTRLGVHADFTDQVSSYIEFDNYHYWGEGFQSDWITGVDLRRGAGDTAIHQAYVQADDMWGSPLALRIGRQELHFGSGWLVGTNSNAPYFTGLSFDGVRATYAVDEFSVDVFGSQLASRGPEWSDQVSFAGVYASWLGVPDNEFDLYWLWLRDPQSLPRGFFFNYDKHNMHTVGLRGAGSFEGFDYEAEVAYQWGDASLIGVMEGPGILGDDSAKYSNWAGQAEVGYTFDAVMQPRVYLKGAYIGGEDERHRIFRRKASVSFNRLFSDVHYSNFFGFRNMSNVWTAGGGVQAMLTEDFEVDLVVSHLRAVDAHRPGWFRRNSSNLGWEAALTGTYHYTEDLAFEGGYAHLFTGSGMDPDWGAPGNFVSLNGLASVRDTAGSDAHYFFLETRLSF